MIPGGPSEHPLLCFSMGQSHMVCLKTKKTKKQKPTTTTHKLKLPPTGPYIWKDMHQITNGHPGNRSLRIDGFQCLMCIIKKKFSS